MNTCPHCGEPAPTHMERTYYCKTAIVEAQRRGVQKVGRNEPCPCGTGKKYKHCCGDPCRQNEKLTQPRHE